MNSIISSSVNSVVVTSLKAKNLIRDIPDFPKPGIIFKDISPVLQSPEAFREVVQLLSQKASGRGADVIVGVESRGFIFGAPIALELGIPFALARKSGKLPYDRISEEYSLEYGSNIVEMHVDAFDSGLNVYVVDDLLATGGTAKATQNLVERLGGAVCGFGFMVELSILHGRSQLESGKIDSLIVY